MYGDLLAVVADNNNMLIQNRLQKLRNIMKCVENSLFFF